MFLINQNFIKYLINEKLIKEDEIIKDDDPNQIVSKLFNEYTNFNTKLDKENNKKIVKKIKEFVEKGANKYNLFLTNSINIRNIELTDFFIKKGAKITQEMIEIVYKNNDLDMFIYMINEDKKLDKFNLRNLERKEVLDFLIKRNIFDDGKVLYEAIENNDQEIIKYFNKKINII